MKLFLASFVVTLAILTLIGAAHCQIIPTTPPRAIVSFSPGQNIGQGMYVWRANACNHNSYETVIDQGDVESSAIWAGLAVVGPSEALISNNLQRNRSKSIVGAQLAQGATGLGMALLAIRTVAANSAWGTAAVAGFYVAGQLVNYFKSVSPGEFNARFDPHTVLGDNTTFKLAPVSQSNHCAVSYIFTKTKKGAKPVPDVMIK